MANFFLFLSTFFVMGMVVAFEAFGEVPAKTPNELISSAVKGIAIH